MCSPASMIITKNDVLYSVPSNSHEITVRENNLDDSTTQPNFVRIEITPPNNDYSQPLDKWIYSVDQDFLPGWYVKEVDERRARKKLKQWYYDHIKRQCTDAPNQNQTAGDFATQTAGYKSTQRAGDKSTQRAGIKSSQTAGYWSTQKAGDNSTQTAGINTVQICYWYDGNEKKIATRKINAEQANKPYKFQKGKWRKL